MQTKVIMKKHSSFLPDPVMTYNVFFSSTGYLDNVPMKLSKKFEPFDFPIEYDVLPELKSHEELMQRVS